MRTKHFLNLVAVAFMLFALSSCKTNSGGSGFESGIDMVASGEPEVLEVTGAPNVPAPVGERGPKNG